VKICKADEIYNHFLMNLIRNNGYTGAVPENCFTLNVCKVGRTYTYHSSIFNLTMERGLYNLNTYVQRTGSTKHPCT